MARDKRDCETTRREEKADKIQADELGKDIETRKYEKASEAERHTDRDKGTRTQTYTAGVRAYRIL